MKRLDKQTKHKFEDNNNIKLQTILNILSQESGNVVKGLESEIQKQRIDV